MSHAHENQSNLVIYLAQNTDLPSGVWLQTVFVATR
jgi:hypothetical protein